MSRRSADLAAIIVMCSVLPVRSVTGLCPLANSSASGVTSLRASGVRTGYTSAPCLMSSLMVPKHSTAAMLPVMPIITVLPLSLVLFSQ